MRNDYEVIPYIVSYKMPRPVYTVSSTVLSSTNSKNGWNIIGTTLKESIEDIKHAREENHTKYPSLFVT